MDIRAVPLTHPDAAALIEGLQAEYVVRYGGRDETPVDAAEFVPPQGIFLIAYADGRSGPVPGAAARCRWPGHGRRPS